jgi:hypothetical protein
MSDVKDHLDQLFGIEEENDESKEIEKVEEEPSSQEIIPADEHFPAVAEKEEGDRDRDIDFDYELSRETHRDLIDQGQEAIAKLLKVAEESQHPRAYEVVGQLLKNVSDMTDKLMALQEKRKKLEDAAQKESKTIGGVNVDKAVFVGTTSELLKEIKNVKDATKQ